MKSFPRVFIGHDFRENIAHNVLANSIQRLSSTPVSITQVALNQLKPIFDRPRHPMQSNDFSFSRFLVPFLCEYQDWAIWMDCDMLALADIGELWAMRDGNYAVQVVKHYHEPVEERKYLGNTQTQYQRKNWSSLMMFNCSMCKKLTPAYVGSANGLDLHQFKWIDDDMIGAIPLEWNYLVGYNDLKDIDSDVKMAHFTSGGPYFEDAEFYNMEFYSEWWDELEDMTHCDSTRVYVEGR